MYEHFSQMGLSAVAFKSPLRKAHQVFKRMVWSVEMNSGRETPAGVSDCRPSYGHIDYIHIYIYMVVVVKVKWPKDINPLSSPNVQVAGFPSTPEHPWSTMDCSQPAAWTMNRSHLVVSAVKAFPKRLTNSVTTLPRAAHMDGDVIGCDQYVHRHHSVNAMASPNMRPTPLGFVPHAYHPPPPSQPPPTHHSHNQLNCDKLVCLPHATLAPLRSSSGVWGNITTTAIKPTLLHIS